MINYNEMFKINENCKTKIEKVENHTVLTIDNFYKYPNKIYDYMEKSKKFKDPNNYYPGIRKKVYNYEEHLNELRTLLKKINFRKNFSIPMKEYILYHNKLLLSEYVPELKCERENICPHFDTDGNDNKKLLAGVCFLSKVNHGGTAIYRNKKLNVYHDCEKFRKSPMNLRFPTDDFLEKKSEYFEVLKLFPMKWNRLIMYDGNLFHSMYVEDDDIFKKNKRITSNYFIPYN
jgi:hypothetical protein